MALSILLAVVFNCFGVASGILLPKNSECPDIDTIQQFPEDLGVQRACCHRFGTLLQTNYSYQMPAINHGVAGGAIKAMRKWPEDEDLQLACLVLLTEVGMWNSKTQEMLGDMGALEVSVEAIKNFGVKAPMIIGLVGYFKNSCEKNRYIIDKLGGTDLVWKLLNDNYNKDMELYAQCFFASSCQPTILTEKLANLGYITHSMKALQDFRNEPGIRGEIISLASMCFSDDPNYLKTWVDEGIIRELVAVMHDESVGGVELDMAGEARLYHQSMAMLEAIAKSNAAWHDEVIRAGAAEQIVDTLMHHRTTDIKESPLSFGKHAVAHACTVLAGLAAGAQPHFDAVRNAVQHNAADKRIRELYGTMDSNAQSTCEFLLSVLK